MEEEDVEKLAALIEQKQHERRVAEALKRKVHWPRRITITILTLIACGILHWVIEDVHLQMFMQSSELALSVIMDSVFARVRDVV